MTQDHVTFQALQGVADCVAPIVGLELSCGPVQAVYVSRILPTDVRDGAVICIYQPDESIGRHPGRPGRRMQRRAIRVQICAVLPRPPGVDNDLERDIGIVKAFIERALGGNPTLVSGEPAQPLTTDLQLIAAGSGFDPKSDLTTVLAWLTYSAIAHHPEGDPTIPLTRIQS